MNKFIYFIFIAIFFVAACDEPIKPPPPPPPTQEDNINKDAINKIIESFSSPVEMAALIEDENVPYSSKYMLDTKKVADFDTNFKKSLGLGMLSADLGYLNVYKKVNDILQYLVGIKKISDDLNVDQFFDFQTLKQLATRNEDLVALMVLSTQSYHNMDEHLRRTSRSDLSALMVTGVWLEGLFLATQVQKQAKSSMLRERIGENKVILSELVVVLKFFKDKPQFGELIIQIEELNSVFQGVQIINHEEPNVITKDSITNITTVSGGDWSEIVMTDEQLEDIISTVEKVRNNIINL